MRKEFKGIYLRNKRKERGFSQMELAKKVNEKYGEHVIDARSISRWESNPSATPLYNKLGKVAEILGLHVDELYEGVRESNYDMISWNINQFCGPLDSKDVKKNKKKDAIEDIQNIYFSKIVGYIKPFLKNAINGIVILQEVPQELYSKFLEEFKGFKILEPVFLNKSVYIYTIAIANQQSKWRNVEMGESIFTEKDTYKNRVVEVQCEDFKVMGVHMPLRSQDQKFMHLKRPILWDTVIEAIGKYHVLIGDFNAHYNQHSFSERRLELSTIINKGYQDLVPNDYVTYFPNSTTLDHVLTSDEIHHNKSTCEIIPKDFSDHAVIKANIVVSR